MEQFMEDGEWLIRGANGWKGKLNSHKRISTKCMKFNTQMKWQLFCKSWVIETVGKLMELKRSSVSYWKAYILWP